jgi:hypothetical protein
MTIPTAHAPHIKLASKPISEQLLYKRMGHLNQEYVRLLPQAVKQEFQVKYEKNELYEVCVLLK